MKPSKHLMEERDMTKENTKTLDNDVRVWFSQVHKCQLLNTYID